MSGRRRLFTTMSAKGLLCEYVREILLIEDDGGGFGGGDTGGVWGDLAMYDATMSPWGVSFGDDAISDAFIKPFTDVFGVAAGKTKKLSAKTQTLAKVAYETIATTIIPTLKDSYEEIFSAEDEKIKKIQEEYHDVFQRTWTAFLDHDALLAAFLYSPVTFLTATMTKKSPNVVMNMLSVLTGGSLDEWLEKIKERYDITGEDQPTEKPRYSKTQKGSPGMGMYGMGGYGAYGGMGDNGMGYSEGVIRERGEKKKPQNKKPLEQVLLNKDVLAKVANSDVTKKLEREGRELVRGTLETIYKHAQTVLKANNLQALQQAIGGSLKGTDKLSQVPKEERAAAEQTLMSAMKKSMHAFYVKSLEVHVKKAVADGVPEDSAYVHDFQHVISKIKSL